MTVATLTAVAAVVGAAGSVVAAVGVLVVSAKLARPGGRVETLESRLNAHVDAAGLHR